MPDVRYENPSLKGDGGTLMGVGEENEAGEADKEQVQRVARRFEQAKNDRRQYDMPWDRYRRYYGGDQWSNKLRPAWKARPVMNYTFSIIETTIPMMTDQRPTINVVGKTPDWAQSAELMQDAVRSVFLSNEMDVKEIYVLKDSKMYGTGISKQWYDGRKNEVVISPIDTRYFYLSPGALDIQSSEYCIIAVNRWVSAVERDFPEFKGKIKAGVIAEELTHKPVETVKQYEIDKTFVLTDTGSLLGQGGPGNTSGTEKVVTQIEMWDRDENGQVWVTMVAGGTLLKRRPSPYKNGLPTNPGGSRYPFARCLCYPIASQFWGMGEIAQLESPQDSINRTEAQIADLARLCTSPYMLIHRQSRVSLKDITNRIASYIVYDGDRMPQWMPPPGVSSELFMIVDRAKNHIDNLSGIFEAARGQLPAAKTSGVAIENLQNATSGRVALMTRMFEAYLKEVALQVIDLVKQFYQNRTIRYGEKYIDINVILPDGTVKNDVAAAEFDVEIGVGSTLPVDKGVRYEQALELFDRKAIGRHELLRKSGWSEEDVIRASKELTQETINDQKEVIAEQQIQNELLPQQAAIPGGGLPAEAAQGAAPAPVEGLPTEEEIAAIEAAILGGGKSLPQQVS